MSQIELNNGLDMFMPPSDFRVEPLVPASPEFESVNIYVQIRKNIHYVIDQYRLLLQDPLQKSYMIESHRQNLEAVGRILQKSIFPKRRKSSAIDDAYWDTLLKKLPSMSDEDTLHTVAAFFTFDKTDPVQRSSPAFANHIGSADLEVSDDTLHISLKEDTDGTRQNNMYINPRLALVLAGIPLSIDSSVYVFGDRIPFLIEKPLYVKSFASKGLRVDNFPTRLDRIRADQRVDLEISPAYPERVIPMPPHRIDLTEGRLSISGGEAEVFTQRRDTEQDDRSEIFVEGSGTHVHVGSSSGYMKVSGRENMLAIDRLHGQTKTIHNAVVTKWPRLDNDYARTWVGSVEMNEEEKFPYGVNLYSKGASITVVGEVNVPVQKFVAGSPRKYTPFNIGEGSLAVVNQRETVIIKEKEKDEFPNVNPPTQVIITDRSCVYTFKDDTFVAQQRPKSYESYFTVEGLVPDISFSKDQLLEIEFLGEKASLCALIQNGESRGYVGCYREQPVYYAPQISTALDGFRAVLQTLNIHSNHT